MKRLLFILTLIVGLTTFADAKDKRKGDNDDRWKKSQKETRDDVRDLQQRYGQVRDQVRNSDSRSARQQLEGIGAGVNRVNWQYENGKYDPRELRGRVSQLKSDLSRLSTQLQQEQQQRYRDSRDGRPGGYRRR